MSLGEGLFIGGKIKRSEQIEKSNSEKEEPEQ